MTRRARADLGACAALALLALPTAGVGAVVRDPGCGVMAVPLRESVTIYALPRGFLLAGSDTVRLGGERWRPGADYALDRLRGELRLLRAPVAGETLRVFACWLLEPPPLELRRMEYRPADPAGPDTARQPPPGLAGAQRAGAGFARAAAFRASDDAGGGAVLALRGNKTIAVDFGSNQDAFLRQSLDLALSGTLAPGVELTGVLSDRNTPLTAAGSTEDVAALDRVLIELKAPRGGAALGDVPLALSQGEFARIERRVQGMRADWSSGNWNGAVAAASAPGEFHRVQFAGSEGRQGPYLLTDKDGGLGVSVVAGSEVVTVDGNRMTRGESADYTIDYERARVTFTNRRPISSASRITIEYQYAVNRFKRNLLAAGGRWVAGPATAYFQALSEGDDRGRPLDLTLSGEDRLRLEAAGDSAALALGPGVAEGTGDYDTLTVDSALVFVYAGRDSGRFAVQFSRVGAGGEYAETAVVGGRAVYEYVGPGRGTHRVGRLLPLPESRRLWSGGGTVRAGPLALELEGALSNLDRNLFSSRDDADDRGEAGRAALKLEGDGPAWLGRAGIEIQARAVGERFAPFGRLERGFAEEDWGLPLDADFEHQRRIGLRGHAQPFGGRLEGAVARIALPRGFSATRGDVQWAHDRGPWRSQVRLERAEAENQALRFSRGGRERARAELRVRLPWIEPGVRLESDLRRTPSDTGRVAHRAREAGVELATGRALPWRATVSASLRRDALPSGEGFAEQSETRVSGITMESPAGGPLGVTLALQRRDLTPKASPSRTRSDLGTVRLRAEDLDRGLRGQIGLEITSEGENRRERRLVFVGTGQGAYDALGNLVGRGDYDLVVTVSPELERLARAATSALLGWRHGGEGALRGSRVEMAYETEARRAGDLKWRDPFPSPGAIGGDPGLERGSVLQRIETDLAPESRAGAVRLRVERRASGDRSFENFAQSQDDRTVSARWRTRPAVAWSTEVETRWRRQAANQELFAGARYRRVLREVGGTAQIAFVPSARLRGALAGEAAWTRPDAATQATRTIRLGPEAGVSVGERGRLELSLRRAFIAGPPAVGLFPSADPAGAPEWEGWSRFDYRVRESVHASMQVQGQDHAERRLQMTGRVELRAFF